MKGLSERAYAERIGMSRGAVQKAKAAGRLALFADGSIDPGASDARRVEATDPSKQRGTTAPPAAAPVTTNSAAAPASRLKPVPEAALAAVGDTLRDSGMAVPVTGGGMTFLQAKTANEVLKAQERKLRLAKLKGELVERDRARAMVFRLAREERDAWVTWPARVAALMAAEIGVEAAVMQTVLEIHVRAHLDALAELRIGL